MAKKRANGEGSIRKRKDGRWEGRYTVGYDPTTGKRRIKNVLGATQGEVKEKLRVALKNIKALDMTREDYTVASWLHTWYDLYAEPNVRPSTARSYRGNIEQHVIPHIGHIKLTKLTGRNIQRLYKDLQEHGRLREAQKEKKPGLSNATVRGIHMMLHNALDRAVKERLILRNPTEDCIIPKLEKQEMKILRPEDMKDYLQAAEGGGVLPMFYLELVTGLRKGELVALLWEDLDTTNNTISVSKQLTHDKDGNLTVSRPKTETSIRQVSIPQEAVELLIQEHKKHPDSSYLFPSPLTGQAYHPDSIVNLHKKILKDANLPHIRFHDLRHPYVKQKIKIKSVKAKILSLHFEWLRISALRL